MSDASPHFRHRVQMPDGKHVEVVYGDHRSDPGARELHSTGPAKPAYAAGRSGALNVHGALGARAELDPASSLDPARSLDCAGSLAKPAPQPAGFSTPQGPVAPSAEHACAPHQLHVCFNCSSRLVYPLDWAEEGPRRWRIVLRCPDCEAHREGVFEQSVVERLDDELDRGAGALLSDLKRLTHSNMTDEIEFFARALAADLITPSDF